MRRSSRKGTKSPATAFIEGARHGHNACAEGQAGRRATVAHFPPGEKFEAPTPSDPHARCTRALISQAKRPIRLGHNDTAVSSPHAPLLKRSALKSYVRAVSSRASGARPPADQSRGAVSIGHRLRLARPPTNPEQKSQGGSRQARIPSRPTPILQTNLKKPFRAKNPQAMATYVPEVARLTCKNRFEQSPQDDSARDD